MKQLFTLAIAITCLAFNSLSQMPSTLPLVTTTGKAIVYAQPDEALISFTVTTSDDLIIQAKEKNADISRSTISYLKKQGVKEEHIQTQYLTVGKNYRHDRNPQGEDQFQATQNFSVCVTDLKNLENIMMGLLGLEISNLGSPLFRSTELEKYKDEARVLALQNAKHKATLMTTALEQSLGKVHSISESAPSNHFKMAYMAEADNSGSGSGGDSFAIGQMEISAQITVSFMIENVK